MVNSTWKVGFETNANTKEKLRGMGGIRYNNKSLQTVTEVNKCQFGDC